MCKVHTTPQDNAHPAADVERPNGSHVHIPNRDPRLPHFYLVKNHAQVKKSWGAKRVFVYLQDSSTKAMKDTYDFLSHMKFPEGTARGIKKGGECI